MDSSKHNFTNRLIHEASPYLLQHAHNPVDWFPWCEEAFLKAESEKKLVLVSIGYSSCHWCHVMERECFEDEETAGLMNEKFVCIKVDREERPDVDSVYMSAVQLMNGNGGWPLNCFTLPDKKPVYGGTYFPNVQWKNVLTQLSDFYEKDPGKAKEYSEELAAGIKNSDSIKVNPGNPVFEKHQVEEAYEAMQRSFDTVEGGPNRAPKFPMPNNYLFLLRYYFHTKQESCLKQINLTLEKMAYGGIYDQLGGGFSRYSTDSFWKAPHFEKMLYDNAQLVSLYSEAFQLTKNPLFKQVVYETLDFINREMTSPEGGFYSALDADSEGEEGKFYVWKKEEIQKLVDEKSFPVFCDYYNVNEIGLWEHGNHILLRKKSAGELAAKYSISEEELEKLISSSKKILFNERIKRPAPMLDDKILTSWNGLMGKAYTDAYKAFGEKKFLEAALKNANLVVSKLKKTSGELYHVFKNGNASIHGFLEDYCFVTEAFIGLYECTFEERWLLEAKNLADYSILHFQDKESGMFYFTSDQDEEIITRKMELQDNVIPSSNSCMARNLFLLSHFFEEKKYRETSENMLHQMIRETSRSSPWYSNWAILLVNFTFSFYEIALTGKDTLKWNGLLNEHFIPNKLVAGSYSPAQNELPLLKDRWKEGETLIYICKDTICQLPLDNMEKAFRLLEAI